MRAMQAIDGQVGDTALIVGCGYLGRRLAATLLGRGATVYGTTRDSRGFPALRELGVRPLAVELTQGLTLAALRPALAAPTLDVFVLVPPGPAQGDPTARQVVLTGGHNLIAVLAHHAAAGEGRVRRVVVASSTGVYGQSQGELVDAHTPPVQGDERSQLLLEGERLWLSAALPVRIARLAGLYGPGRVVGLNAVRDGAPLAGDPDAWLNLIHVDDAVDMLIRLAEAPEAASIELASDGTPVRRAEYYAELARRLGVAAPVALDAAQARRLGLDSRRLERASTKRCDPGPTIARTGWRPRYPSYREGLQGLV